jgi:two-component system chemotaxis response regulator CheB
MIADVTPSNAAREPYRVLIVDDSAVIRGFMSRAFEGDPHFRVVGKAQNGQVAIDILRTTVADVVILDIEMPVMDGLSTIPHLKTIDPAVQIIMASTLTQKNAEISFKALALGATDYIPKPSFDQATPDVKGDFNRELIDRVRGLGALARRRGVRLAPGATASKPRPVQATPVTDNKRYTVRGGFIPRPAVIGIGASTGGPQALIEVIKVLGPDLRQPVFITQHMPASFTTIFADQITRQCGVICTEGKDGEIVKPGHYYLAPGDYHMQAVQKSESVVVKLTKEPPENFCRPAVDPMMRSLVDVYGKRVLAVILTGMGQDGAKGCAVVVKAGGAVIAQDEATSVVWGMPGAVTNAGLCNTVLPLLEVGPMVRQIAQQVGP